MMDTLLKEVALQDIAKSTPKSLVVSQLTKTYQLFWEIMGAVKNTPSAFEEILDISCFEGNPHLIQFFGECQTMWKYMGQTETPIFLVQTLQPQYKGVAGAYNPHGNFLFINLSIYERVVSVQSFERIMIEHRETLCHEILHSFQGLSPANLEGRTQDEYYSFWWEIEAYMVGKAEKFLFGDAPTPATQEEFVEWVDTNCPNKKRLKNGEAFAQYILTCHEMWEALQEYGDLWKSFQPKSSKIVEGLCPFKVIEDVLWLQHQTTWAITTPKRYELSSVMEAPNYIWEFNSYVDSTYTEDNKIILKIAYDDYAIEYLVEKGDGAIASTFKLLGLDDTILNIIQLVKMYSQIGIDFDDNEVWETYFVDYPHELFINNKNFFV